MNLQKKIISIYLEKNGHKALRVMATELDIQTTRLHRIINGSEMKISEYEKFKSYLTVDRFENQFTEFTTISQKAMRLLGIPEMNELKYVIKNMLHEYSIKNGQFSNELSTGH